MLHHPFFDNKMGERRHRSRSPRDPDDFIPVPAAPKSQPAPSRPPWLSSSTLALDDPLLQLHEELIDFHNFTLPTPGEKAAQINVIKRLEMIGRELWTDAQVRTFGSMETGLWVPGSDIDVVVLTEQETDVQNMINDYATLLLERKIACELERILNARVPIIKMKDKETDLTVDICFNVENGLAGVEVVKQYLERYPEVPYLVSALKIFLKQRGLNDTYNGGVGSFLLFCTVVSAVQQHSSHRRDRSKYRYFTLGHYFMYFLRLYGQDLDYERVGVSIRGEGSFFNKHAKNWRYPERDRTLLALECPQNPENDLGRNSYNIELVRKAYEHAYKILCAQTFKQRGQTPLSSLIRCDRNLLDRK